MILVSSPSSPEATCASPAAVLSRTGKGRTGSITTRLSWSLPTIPCLTRASSTPTLRRRAASNTAGMNSSRCRRGFRPNSPIAPSASGCSMRSRAMVSSTTDAASGSRNRGAVSGSTTSPSGNSSMKRASGWARLRYSLHGGTRSFYGFTRSGCAA
ncbi:hypothetical protein RHECNPAF_1740016 [Rhizobium etli CNPAF512]|nr:hypothetical protein RHECNPAF_1740016 [Rhizobium etli CNPAF512]